MSSSSALLSFDIIRFQTYENKRALAPQVPGIRGQHPGHDDTADDVHDLISDTRQSHGLLSQPSRPDFADKSVTDRSQGGIVGKVEDDQ